jgi:hypothetical protein
MAHLSDSQEQRAAEILILEAIERQVGCALESRRLQFHDGASVDVNGVAPDESVLVEVSAHQGPPKGGQRHKIAADLLKLITLAQGRDPKPRLILAFADHQAAAWSTGKSWLAASLAAWQVEVIVVDLAEEVRAGIRAAQTRQVMVNPAPAPAPNGLFDDRSSTLDAG